MAGLIPVLQCGRHGYICGMLWCRNPCDRTDEHRPNVECRCADHEGRAL